MKMVVVHLFDRKVFFRVSQNRAQRLVQMKVGFSVLAGKPLFNALLEQGLKLLRGLCITLLLGNVQNFADALQSFALPIGAIANLEHVATGVAQIGVEQAHQRGLARVVLDARPIGHKAVVLVFRRKLVACQEADGPANGVVCGAELALNTWVLMPMVWVKPQQRPRLLPFHELGGGRKFGFDQAALFVV